MKEDSLARESGRGVYRSGRYPDGGTESNRGDFSLRAGRRSGRADSRRFARNGLLKLSLSFGSLGSLGLILLTTRSPLPFPVNRLTRPAITKLGIGILRVIPITSFDRVRSRARARVTIGLNREPGIDR